MYILFLFSFLCQNIYWQSCFLFRSTLYDSGSSTVRLDQSVCAQSNSEILNNSASRCERSLVLEARSRGRGEGPDAGLSGMPPHCLRPCLRPSRHNRINSSHGAPFVYVLYICLQKIARPIFWTVFQKGFAICSFKVQNL